MAPTSSLTLPPDLAEGLRNALHWPRHPAVRRFLDQVRAGRAWSPVWPRRLHQVAEQLGISLPCERFARCVLLPGFGWRYVVAAIAVLLAIGFKILMRREQRVAYAGSRSLLIFETGKQPAGPAGSLPMPMQYPSPAGPASSPTTSTTAPQSPPWGRGEILHG